MTEAKPSATATGPDNERNAIRPRPRDEQIIVRDLHAARATLQPFLDEASRFRACTIRPIVVHVSGDQSAVAAPADDLPLALQEAIIDAKINVAALEWELFATRTLSTNALRRADD